MNGEDLSVRESVLGSAAQRGGVLRAVWWAKTSASPAAAGAPVTSRTPGSTREKSYWQQVYETVWVTLAFVALGLLLRWMTR